MGIPSNEVGGNFVTINHESTIVNHLCNIEPPYDGESRTSQTILISNTCFMEKNMS
jgi:hypothetical protein